jgi:hypothetical protein
MVVSGGNNQKTGLKIGGLHVGYERTKQSRILEMNNWQNGFCVLVKREELWVWQTSELSFDHV